MPCVVSVCGGVVAKYVNAYVFSLGFSSATEKQQVYSLSHMCTSTSALPRMASCLADCCPLCCRSLLSAIPPGYALHLRGCPSRCSGRYVLCESVLVPTLDPGEYQRGCISGCVLNSFTCGCWFPRPDPSLLAWLQALPSRWRSEQRPFAGPCPVDTRWT